MEVAAAAATHAMITTGFVSSLEGTPAGAPRKATGGAGPPVTGAAGATPAVAKTTAPVTPALPPACSYAVVATGTRDPLSGNAGTGGPSTP